MPDRRSIRSLAPESLRPNEVEPGVLRGNAAARVALSSALHDLVGKRLNMALGDLAAGKANEAKIDWIAKTTLKLRDANAATTLGWRDYDARRLDAARTWFEQAMLWQATPRAASGLAQVRLAAGDFDGAEQIARQWVDSAPELSVACAGSGRVGRCTVSE